MTDEDFGSFVDGTVASVERGCVDVLDRLGRYCYDVAVSSGSYMNRTGTLRSSIGYGVVRYGQLVTSGGFVNFHHSNSGPAIGRDLLNEAVGRCDPDSLCLIVVAGAEYATYVENMGYDVLTRSEIEGHKMADTLLEQLFK